MKNTQNMSMYITKWKFASIALKMHDFAIETVFVAIFG